MAEKKEWTLMFLFASDNPLAPSIVSQLKTIKQAGFHQEVNVIAQFDPQPEGTPTHIFDVNLINKLNAVGPGRSPDQEPSQIGFIGSGPDNPFVSNLIEDKLWRDQQDRNDAPVREQLRALLNRKHGISYDPPVPPPDTKEVKPAVEAKPAAACAHPPPAAPGSEEGSIELNPRESLQAFLTFCRDKYPARHYILFILGHGVVVANDIFLFDEHADEQSLSLKDLGCLLSKFKEGIGEDSELELVSFHSCSVSSVEVAYELQGTANRMLAAQGPSFVGTWPYRQILMRVFKTADYLKGLEESGAPAARVRECVDEMLRDITAYCFHNSKDFLLAGYSSDIALSNLNAVQNLTQPLVNLGGALRAGLDDALVRNFILLAHWESQSDWQESYTDLQDFCFCLRRQCANFEAMFGAGAEQLLGPTLTRLRDVIRECDVLIDLLANGTGRGSNAVVLKNRYAGPGHQYSHGLSVYFPWSRPVDDRRIFQEYKEYRFNQETRWRDFLEEYFDKTRRQSQKTETNSLLQARGLAAARSGPDEALSEDLASLVFNGEGRLSAENSLALPADKVNPRDTTGDGCSCATIKNHPRDTRASRDKQQRAVPKLQSAEESVPLSQGESLIP